MLGFGVILGLFGLGASLVLTDQDDVSEPAGNDEIDLDAQESENMPIVPIDSFLPDAEGAATGDTEAALPADASASEEEPAVLDAPVQEQAETSQSTANAFDPEMDVDEGTDTGEHGDEGVSADVRIQAGGPGDILTGQLGEDHFQVTLGAADSEATIIECFDCDGSDDPASLSADEMLDTIWFRQDDGEMLTQDELLEMDFFIEENDEIDGISLVFSEHQSVHLPGMDLDDFVENSMVIGNFGVLAA
jgi:hypothetical protein